MDSIPATASEGAARPISAPVTLSPDHLVTLSSPPDHLVTLSSAPPLLERRHWLAALAVLVVFFAPYQTLVQTVLTDDAVRKGLNIDEYEMTWQQVGYGVGILYGLFTGLWLSARIGAR